MTPLPSRELPKPLEKDIVKVIKDWAALRYKITLHRIRENPWTSEPGLPDLFGHTREGRAVYVEVKRPKKGKRSQAQERFIAEARASGAIAFFADSTEAFDEGMRGAR